MKRNRKRSGVQILLGLLMALAILPVTALARGPLETEHPTSLAMDYPCEGAEFRLFQVAEVSRYAAYTATPAFAAYTPDFADVVDQTGWQALAQTLAAYAQRDGVTPDVLGDTDAAGKLSFAGLKTGLYLVTVGTVEKDEYVYRCAPFLVALPELDAKDQWVYDVTASPKYEKIPLRDLVDEKQVVKVWKDGDASGRPDYVEIQLICDGEVWDTVTLNADNQWRHTWTHLDKGHTWQVVEKNIPDGYTVSVEQEGDLFIVTNRKPAGPQDPTLPQTGMLWWPVGLLAASGMALFLLGWSRKNHSHDEK